MESFKEEAIRAGVRPENPSFMSGISYAESGKQKLLMKEFEAAVEGFSQALQLFEQAKDEMHKRRLVWIGPACDGIQDINDPIGFVCNYFRDCQRRDADSAISKEVRSITLSSKNLCVMKLITVSDIK